MTVKLCLAQDPEADALLEACPFALLSGMLLDQQVPMEVAFAGPKKIADRIHRNHVGQQIPMEVAFAGPKKIADRIAGFGSNRVGTSQQIPMEVAFAGPKKIADRLASGW